MPTLQLAAGPIRMAMPSWRIAMAAVLDRTELRRLARIGAAERLAQLERERATLLRAFPGLSQLAGRDGTDAAASNTKSPRRRRRRMSAEARKAVSARMKKYWADRRAKRKTAGARG